MKAFASGALSCAIILSAFAADTTPPVSAADVVVEPLALSLPRESQAAAKVLWTSFANKPAEQKLASITVVGWRQLYSEFAEALVRRAAEAKLEAEALGRVLTDIDQKRGSLALMPIGAYRATQGEKAIWIVVCKWEIESAASNPKIRLGHVRIFAYDILTIEQVAFKTCM